MSGGGSGEGARNATEAGEVPQNGLDPAAGRAEVLTSLPSPMARLLSLLLIGAVIAGCDSADERPPRQLPPATEFDLIYSVEPTPQMGAPSADVIRFVGADGETGTLRNVSLPWFLPVQAPVDVDRVYSLEAELTVGGDVTGMVATLTVDDQPVSQGVVSPDPGGLNQTRTARAVWRYSP